MQHNSDTKLTNLVNSISELRRNDSSCTSSSSSTPLNAAVQAFLRSPGSREQMLKLHLFRSRNHTDVGTTLERLWDELRESGQR